MSDLTPLAWPVAELVRRYADGSVSPVEVAQEALRRIELLDDRLHAFLSVAPELTLAQARAAEARYRAGEPVPPLLGVPVSIKDLFDLKGTPSTMGSLVFGAEVSSRDSLLVARLRDAGAVFVGKTNTAEFGQSATTENRLGASCANPWDVMRTPGGSSGGAAASVAAGLASVALGSDGGGSIRIPAAFCGLFGIKPTYGLIDDDSVFRGMTDFVCAGPLARRVADGRLLLEALTGRAYPASTPPRRLRIAWCPRPQGHPVDPGVLAVVTRAVEAIEAMGHDVVEEPPPVDGWQETFAPLVLADEWRYRRQLLDGDCDALTSYARRALEAASHVPDADVEAARNSLAAFRERFRGFFQRFDLILTPTTATVAFPIGERPTMVAGEPTDRLWGAFPFTAAFNVSGCPAATLPCGLSDGLPVGIQIVGGPDAEQLVLDVCQELEAALEFPVAAAVIPAPPAAATVAGAGRYDVAVERRGPVSVLWLSRPAKRNALLVGTLERLRARLAEESERGAAAIVLTGAADVFSAGMDLGAIGDGEADVAVDDAIAATVAAIQALPVPVVAAIEGPCIGAALELALACDVRVAGGGASFALPATRLGVLYRIGGLATLVGRAGYQTAARLLLVDERLTADDALTAGLVARVVDRGGAVDAALQLARRAAGCVPEAVALTKAVLVETDKGAVDGDAWEGERRRLLAGDERRDAVRLARLDPSRSSGDGATVNGDR